MQTPLPGIGLRGSNAYHDEFYIPHQQEPALARGKEYSIEKWTGYFDDAKSVSASNSKTEKPFPQYPVQDREIYAQKGTLTSLTLLKHEMLQSEAGAVEKHISLRDGAIEENAPTEGSDLPWQSQIDVLLRRTERDLCKGHIGKFRRQAMEADSLSRLPSPASSTSSPSFTPRAGSTKLTLESLGSAAKVPPQISPPRRGDAIDNGLLPGGNRPFSRGQ